MDDDTAPSIAVKGGWYRLHELPAVLASLWQPIETAPDDGRFVLAWVRFPSGNGHWNILQRDIDGEWFDDNGHRLEPYEATHWMPLPEPPVE